MSLKYCILAAISSSFAIAAQAQYFTPGDLVVVQIGDGSSTLTSAGTAVFLDQFTTGGTFVNDLAIPSTGANALVDSGTASSEGQLSLSANGSYFVLGGYNVAAGTAGVGSATSSAVPRGVGIVDNNGNFTLAATTTTFYGGNNMRGAASDGNGNYWGSGAASGTVYLGSGSPAQIVASNSVAIQDIGGNLFYSTAKGVQGIWEVSGAPTSGTATPTQIIAMSNPSAFAFNSAMTIAYVANTSGGVDRFDFNGTSWTLTYALDGSTKLNGLAVDFSGVDPILYATTANGTQLIDITDTGSGSLQSILATAGANEAFSGLQIAPVPEPSTLALSGLGGLLTLWQIRRRK